jgi:hypothetical protein
MPLSPLAYQFMTEYRKTPVNRDSVQWIFSFGPPDGRREVHILGCLTIESQEVQIEQVITRFTHSASIRASHVVEDPSMQQPFGITIDLLSLSWEILDGSAIASLDLSIWVYLPCDGEIQAVSLIHKMRTLIRIPEISSSMRIEAKFRVEDIEVTPDEIDNEIVIEAVAFIEGLVLDKRILHVVTGVMLERDTCRVLEDEGFPAGFRLLAAIGNLFNRIAGILRRNR